MKIQCDVCSKSEAAVYCTADEAALCSGCDHRVHHANKLASKHQRFSLHNPSSSSKQFPLCDICQEKRAFLFCQQDRAILCKECDHPIHSANEHTQSHNRFILTGVKLSPTAERYQSTPSSVAVKPTKSTPPLSNNPKGSLVNNNPSSTSVNTVPGGLTSSISEYLIETLPGWQVEDLLLDNFSNKNINQEDDAMISPFLDCELENGNLGMWVPQAPSPLIYSCSDSIISFKDMNTKLNDNNNGVVGTRRYSGSDDGCFTVPQINSHTVGSKRSREFW